MDMRLVDLSGVPEPEPTLQQHELYARLAPFVGVAPPVFDPGNPSQALLCLAISRQGGSINAYPVACQSLTSPAITVFPGGCASNGYTVGRGVVWSQDQKRSPVSPYGKQPDRHDSIERVDRVRSDDRERNRPSKQLAAGEETLSESGAEVLRGWYATREEPRWCPCQSRFGGRAGRHLGVDLAAPPGVPVLSPIEGVAEYNPLGDDPTRGNHIFIYSGDHPPHGVLLCHLQSPAGHYPRRVEIGEPLAKLGFSEGSPYSGKTNVFGKYDTHLHVEVVTGYGHVDPLAFFDLSPRYVDDLRCFFPSDPSRLTVRVPHPLLPGRARAATATACRTRCSTS